MLDFHSEGSFHFRKQSLTWSELGHRGTLGYDNGGRLRVMDRLPLCLICFLERMGHVSTEALVLLRASMSLSKKVW